ncbi:glycine-rich cell wall structural protein-like isoform X4 [Corvus kubaryi]|uniref:glycine-rich cell wall structural protein-like isoform X4 n=1 Tax=Corvus kubaryi TaxID=68294 RepID=UPI001C04C6E4|nr:glycine-rich cell wall structural protein-like isoform X4 [Corvus kubaryi]
MWGGSGIGNGRRSCCGLWEFSGCSRGIWNFGNGEGGGEWNSGWWELEFQAGGGGGNWNVGLEGVESSGILSWRGWWPLEFQAGRSGGIWNSGLEGMWGSGIPGDGLQNSRLEGVVGFGIPGWKEWKALECWAGGGGGKLWNLRGRAPEFQTEGDGGLWNSGLEQSGRLGNAGLERVVGSGIPDWRGWWDLEFQVERAMGSGIPGWEGGGLWNSRGWAPEFQAGKGMGGSGILGWSRWWELEFQAERGDGVWNSRWKGRWAPEFQVVGSGIPGGKGGGVWNVGLEGMGGSGILGWSRWWRLEFQAGRGGGFGIPGGKGDGLQNSRWWPPEFQAGGDGGLWNSRLEGMEGSGIPGWKGRWALEFQAGRGRCTPEFRHSGCGPWRRVPVAPDP